MSKIKNVIRGDSHTINLSVIHSDNTPVDLTGGTVFFTVNASDDPTDDTGAVIEKSVTSHTDPTAGLTSIALAPDDTNSITPGTYFYDVQIKDASGNISSLPQDKFVLVADITRRTS